MNAERSMKGSLVSSLRRCRNWVVPLLQDQIGVAPAYGHGGSRFKGGMNSRQELVRNGENVVVD